MLLCYCCQRCHHVSGKRCLPNCDVVLGPLDFWRGDAVALRLLDCSMKCLMKFMTRQEATIGRNSTAVFKLVFCFHMSCFRFFVSSYLLLCTRGVALRLIYCWFWLVLFCFCIINNLVGPQAPPSAGRHWKTKDTHIQHTQHKRSERKCDAIKVNENEILIQYNVLRLGFCSTQSFSYVQIYIGSHILKYTHA